MKVSNTPLWPNLGFRRIGALDYSVNQYDAEWLLHVAGRLQDDSGRAGNCVALGPLQWSVGECLRQLAHAPAALKELNHYLDRAPQAVRGLNIAVHYLARRELDGSRKSKQSLSRVAKTWSIADTSVKDAQRKYGGTAKNELETIIRLCLSRPHQAWDRCQVLAALDADMRERTKLPWLKQRKSNKKLGRRK